MESSTKPKIIYIAGAGHSGSTLLDLILSTASNTFSVGELKHLDQFLKDDAKPYYDDTGNTAKNSPFWSWFYDQYHMYVPARAKERVLSFTNKCWLFMFGTPYVVPQRYNDNDQLYQDLLLQARTVTGNTNINTIIDSSKVTSRLIEVSERCEQFDVYVIHLVRDVRGVVYSHYKTGRSAWKWAFNWMMTNIGIRRYAKKRIQNTKYIPLRYEQLTADLVATVHMLNQTLDLDLEPDTLIQDINTQKSFRFGGNGMRTQNMTTIKRDTKWRTALPRIYSFILAPFNTLIANEGYTKNKL